ncbi:MAG: rRNA pseudouridine synthase [Candidatus Eisenbacteria bacterium]|uniref:Pseudouridine synthase n=1 Tax=Eiseniibacteriota bacterium TaxID=2212470 RepID=A0A538SYJ2_UNCEI|nr:MAG: rRNA pseudouridine synthase [Candidatus Eisenbacteria bacterium]
MRLNQFLARAGSASRREADRWIREGRVRINGAPPEGMGPDVDPRRDRVTLDGNPLRWDEELRYLAYHKPQGALVSRRSQGGNPTIFDLLGDAARGLHAVGRLDLESEGLLLLTNDGVLAEALLHPRTGIERVYRIWVVPVPDVPALRRLREGATIEGIEVAPDRVLLEGVEQGHGKLLVQISQGKKREVRLLARAAGLHVTRLQRVQFGPIRLEGLPPGRTRPLTRSEVRALQESARPPDRRGSPRPKARRRG